MDFSGIYCTEMQKILLPLGLAPSFAHTVVHAVWVHFLAYGAQSFSHHQKNFCWQNTHNFNSSVVTAGQLPNVTGARTIRNFITVNLTQVNLY